MPDNAAAEAVTRQTALKRASLAADVRHLAQEAARFADSLERGEAMAGEGGRLAQGALQVALQSVWLNGMQETVNWLNAANGEN